MSSRPAASRLGVVGVAVGGARAGATANGGPTSATGAARRATPERRAVDRPRGCRGHGAQIREDAHVGSRPHAQWIVVGQILVGRGSDTSRRDLGSTAAQAVLEALDLRTRLGRLTVGRLAHCAEGQKRLRSLFVGPRHDLIVGDQRVVNYLGSVLPRREFNDIAVRLRERGAKAAGQLGISRRGHLSSVVASR